jgi:hypothetical protein
MTDRTRLPTTSIMQGFSAADDAIIRVHDMASNVIESFKHKSEFKEW